MSDNYDRHNTVDKNSRAYKIAAGGGVMNLPNKLTIARVVMIPKSIHDPCQRRGDP